MKIKVTSTKKMTTKAWEEEGQPQWWVKCKEAPGMSAEIVDWGKFPPTPGCDYLEVVINVDIRTKYVDIGCGKNYNTRVRENDIRVSQIKTNGGRR